MSALRQKEIIMNCAEYIRKHCREELSMEMLADQSGYSACHFSRTFREIVGMPPMEYVKQQRLYGAAKEIAAGRKILDTALAYGYETHSGFTKAFRSLFGYSPVLLRACYVSETFEKGDRERMGLYLMETDVHAAPEELFEILCQTVRAGRIDCGEERLRAVYGLAAELCGGRLRKSGDLYVTHPLNAAVILADMGADGDTICAGLIHDVWELSAEPEMILHREVVTLPMHEILVEYRKVREGKPEEGNPEDERAVLVALADRLHNMRTIEFMDSAVWGDKARETMERFAPLAAKIGNLKCRLEMDELAEKFL